MNPLAYYINVRVLNIANCATYPPVTLVLAVDDYDHRTVGRNQVFERADNAVAQLIPFLEPPLSGKSLVLV